MILRKVVPRLPVVEIERTRSFYSNALGFRVTGTWPEETPSFLILCLGLVELQFYSSSPQEATGDGTLSFDVDDAQCLAEELGRKVAIEWGPEVYSYGRREFGIRDPDGYLLVFSEETEDPATCDPSTP